MKKLLFISMFAALLAAGCGKEDIFDPTNPDRPNYNPSNPNNETIPTNEIWYTSSDGKIVKPHDTDKFGEGVEIVSNTYKNDKGIIKFSAPVTEIGTDAFYSCSSLTSVTIPNSVTTIVDYAFYSCLRLTSVTIPDNVTTIGEFAFRSCSRLTAFYGKFASDDNRCLIVDGVLISFAPAGLTEYTIPDSVTEIGYNAFSDCSSLTSITIPDGVTRILGGAFQSCSSLTSITIPDSVTEIGTSAFAYCPNLTSVYCKATTPPTLGSSVFSGIDDNAKIYVPRASVEAYKAVWYWREYADLIRPYDF